ncbi:MAG: glycosyltransferase family 4 protein [Betaproteobacteria bacterium]
MKVLIVTQYFWPETFRINDVAAALKARGHEPEILTGMPNYPGGRFYPGYGAFSPREERYRGMRVVRVPLVPRGAMRNWQLALNYLSFVISASLCAPFRCRGHYDAILVYEPSPVTVALPAILLRSTRGTPLLFWVQDLWPESLAATGAVTSPRALRWVRLLVDFIYRRCDLVLVSSRGFTEHVLRSGISRERIRYFPNSAETLYRPLPAAPPDVNGELPSGFRIVFAGNIGSAQSFETIVEAADRTREHRDLHWVILGEGNRREWVYGEIDRRGLAATVHLLGHRPVDTMPAYFAAADALLVTLRGDPVFALTVPSKIQSYLACGRPILAAINGEGADIVTESGAGLACGAEDAPRLAAAALQLYRTPVVQREAMGRKGRMYFEANFEREMLLDRLQSWMHDLAGGKSCVS